MRFEEIQIPVSSGSRLEEVLSRMDDTFEGDTGFKAAEKLHLNFCGREQCDPGHTYGPSRRKVFLIHIIVSGKGVLKIGEKTFHPAAGQAFLIKPDELTSYQADQNDPWVYQWIAFSGFDAAECIRNIGFSDQKRVLSLVHIQELLECFDRILKLQRMTYTNALLRQSELLRFIALMIEDQKEVQGEEGYGCFSSIYVKKAVEYILLHYAEPLKISVLAAHLGVNRCYLSDSFRQSLKLSPHEFLCHTRMEKAAELLLNTDNNIQQVAAKTGYPDPFAFSRVFKQFYGQSPRTYREQHRPG